MSDFYADSKQYNSGYQALFTGFYVVLGQRKRVGMGQAAVASTTLFTCNSVYSTRKYVVF
ncbi:hypothetical protein GCM10027346_00580 [Hymenobacter seoulensis]